MRITFQILGILRFEFRTKGDEKTKVALFIMCTELISLSCINKQRLILLGIIIYCRGSKK